MLFWSQVQKLCISSEFCFKWQYFFFAAKELQCRRYTICLAQIAALSTLKSKVKATLEFFLVSHTKE